MQRSSDSTACVIPCNARCGGEQLGNAEDALLADGGCCALLPRRARTLWAAVRCGMPYDTNSRTIKAPRVAGRPTIRTPVRDMP